MNVFEVVKVYAKLIRENKNAYFLKFTMSHPYNNNRTRQYSKSTDGQEWNIWVPKDLCMRITNDYFLINDRLYTKLNNTNINDIQFSKVRLHFTLSTLPPDVNVFYQTLIIKESTYKSGANSLYRTHTNQTRGLMRNNLHSMYRPSSRNEWLH